MREVMEQFGTGWTLREEAGSHNRYKIKSIRGDVLYSVCVCECVRVFVTTRIVPYYICTCLYFVACNYFKYIVTRNI